ncbi:hypothetical protein SERLADRAFT_462499 [Serpula lacrymans var. lacrymans S7.9]|uniref:Uncharacterized protein n=1 Tax=Serpula lacrymans var. lacrymans (strain S7.9) TaxID=578457 RepID=F8NNJ4_SERL9|nr:uncharacterized protein SERLADRAFT_462499 [Serpula lacrymans var. lacrymans S7.9]EGO28051.1 hypothetical protein SERLADRAFT_462499 [Serpula lacrymans var. lacrymans S7.9]
MRPALVRSVSPVPHGKTYQPPAGETSLSRSSSLSRGSIMSAPPMSNPSSTKARQRRSTTDTIMVSANDHERIWDTSTGKDTTPRRASSDTYGSPTPRANKALSESGSTPTPRGKGKQKQKSGSTHTNQYLSANGSSKDTSLMSIVENVTRQNREGWSASYGVPPSNVLRTAAGASRPQNSSGVKLEVPKAPSPGVPVNRSTGLDVKDNMVNGNGSSKAPIMDIPRAPGSVIPASSTEPPPLQHPQPISAASNGQLLTPGTSSIIRGASRPAKSPLRSALKNPSRTPSPVPDQIIHRRSAQEEPGEQRRGRTPERQVANGGPPPQISASRTKVADSDTNSISSYATGRESFEDANDVPPPPPPHDHEGTASTASTSTETQLPRRKSVRVSLQPTFSPTPPALDDEDDDDDDEKAGKGGRYAPWGPNGNGEKGGETRDGRTSEEKDVWEDSSEEDEEYRRARRLLMRVGKKGKGKGKGKGKTT